MNKRKFLLRGIVVTFVLVLYPLFYFAGCIHGTVKTSSMSGFVNITDGLVATNFIENASTVSVFLVGENNQSPDLVVVDFKDNATGRQIGSSTLHPETNTNGTQYFTFNFPNEFTDSTDKRLNATIHRP